MLEIAIEIFLHVPSEKNYIYLNVHTGPKVRDIEMCAQIRNLLSLVNLVCDDCVPSSFSVSCILFP